MNKMTVALVGNPNCGKSTLFNHLTGAKQRVGNWPGVTVEKKEGTFCLDNHEIDVVDLPGIYSLSYASRDAVDEKITCDYILTQKADLIINIIDASNLERHLYLTTQLLELGTPVIVALNMMDIVEKQGARIDVEKLSMRLGCPVVKIQGHKKQGMAELKQAICKEHLAPNKPIVKYPNEIEAAIKQTLSVSSVMPAKAGIQAISLSSNNFITCHRVLRSAWMPAFAGMTETLLDDIDLIIADARYTFINQLTRDVYYPSNTSRAQFTHVLDKIILHRLLGLPIFFAIMYCMFLFAINIGGAFQGFFDIGSDTIFVQGLTALLTQWHFPPWLIVMLASGVGKGINTTITFIPILAAMFLFLSFLEDSGYMVRAAFVMDRLMRALGLPGKSFVPLIVGFGCNVPAIMSSRILENQRDRILTVIMTPFMSCGARLAIFAVFIAAFFPIGGQNIVFALYLIGIAAAVLTGLILQKTLLTGEPAPLVMELPLYHLPQPKTLLLHAWNRLNGFLWRAGQFIVPICILISVLNSMALPDKTSLLSSFGQWLTPLFAPLGLQSDNWPATVGLFTGILAKEVVVGTLNTLYTEVGNLVAASPEQFNFWGGLQTALATVPANLKALTHAFANPILATAKNQVITNGVFGQMVQRFDGRIGAFAYLLFILLYVPCVSTMAVIMRELGKNWMFFSLFWNTSFAYGLAVIFYQTATFTRHPTTSLCWITGILIFNILLVLCLRFSTKKEVLT